jgi:transcriptional regulator of acetoin/glycerol metabolism
LYDPIVFRFRKRKQPNRLLLTKENDILRVFEVESDQLSFSENVGVNKQLLERFHEKSIQNGVLQDSMRVRFRIHGNMMERLVMKNEIIIQIMDNQSYLYKNSFYFPYLLMLLDYNGVILYVTGDEKSLGNAEKMNNVGQGSSLSFSSAGTNAVSVAIDLSRPVYIQGDNHFLNVFKNWISICVPLRNADNEIISYLAFSSFYQVVPSLVYPFIESISVSIELALHKTETHGKAWYMEEVLRERLKHYKLTSREKEIAMYWVLDYDSHQIGKVLGISENTVRVYVGKINNKLKVNSKASLILRVLGAI